MSIKVAIPTSVAAPIPFLDLEKIEYKGKSFVCHQVTGAETLKKLLSMRNWKNIPENIGVLLGQTTKEFLDGLKQGLKLP